MQKFLCLKKLCLALAIISCLCGLSACSGQKETEQAVESGPAVGSGPGSLYGQPGGSAENTGTAGSGRYDIFSDKELVIGLEFEEIKGILRGAQLYQGEPAILSAQGSNSDGKAVIDIWLYSPGEEARVIAEGLPYDEVRFGDGFLDEEGCYYHIGGDKTKALLAITKYDSSGKPAFTLKRNTSNVRMCSLADGKIVLYYSDSETGRKRMEYLEPATGAVSEVRLKRSMRGDVFLGTDGNVPYLIDSSGVYKVNPEDGKIDMWMSFEATSYAMEGGSEQGGSISSFRIKENGDVEILRRIALGSGRAATLNMPMGAVILETLQRKEIAEDKKILTIRTLWPPGNWLKNKIVEFNINSKDYYVHVEGPEDGIYEEDYITRTLLELGTGKGPDILYTDVVLGDSWYSLLQKGIFEDLAPYMERSGMKQEDYFPEAFCSYGNEGKVYGINIEADVRIQAVDGNLLEGVDSVDIDSFLDALLTRGDTAVYEKYIDSGEFLDRFLRGSDTLWGMVDWESGTCRLDTELFAKLLQAAKNLGDSDRKSYTPISYTRFLGFGNIEVYLGEIKSEGRTFMGIPFDDGFHGEINTGKSLKVNANSPNKEGVWEFLSFLLSREAQMTHVADLPVHRGAFAGRAEEIMADQKVKAIILESEDVEWLEAYLEDARFLPVRVQQLIDIIKDEAQYYFGGMKSIDQVRDAAQNRIQLYLDENR